MPSTTAPTQVTMITQGSRVRPPLALPPAETAETLGMITPPGQPLRLVLVVERDARARQVIELGSTIAGGLEALQAAKEEHFDVAVVDLKMPDMDGLTVLRKLKESRPQIPVIIITAQNVMTHAVEAMRVEQ